MFTDFDLDWVDTEQGRIRVRHGGKGMPVLLLHGHPRSHLTWGAVADLLAPTHRVICPDLPGFGRSFQPADAPSSVNSSKRAKAQALLEMMHHLGHRTFSVVGHDRGSYVAFRLAMDHQDVIDKLVVIDCLPIIEHLDRADWKFARDWYHWFFFAQPEKPERAILADPLAWYDRLDPAQMGRLAYEELIELVHDPAVVHGMVEDYRAGLTIDQQHERNDRSAGHIITCPTLCLWSLADDIEEIYGNPVPIWRTWAADVQGFGIQSGHHMAEENPVDLAKALKDFL